MLRIQLDINGREIGTIGVLNTQEYDGAMVRYEIYDMRGDHGDRITDYPQIGEVWHNRADGADGLTARVMEEIDEWEHLDPEVYRQ